MLHCVLLSHTLSLLSYFFVPCLTENFSSWVFRDAAARMLEQEVGCGFSVGESMRQERDCQMCPSLRENSRTVYSLFCLGGQAPEGRRPHHKKSELWFREWLFTPFGLGWTESGQGHASFPLPCLPSYLERNTRHLTCACLADEERRWHGHHRMKARWGVEGSQVSSLGVRVGPSPTLTSSGCRQQEEVLKQWLSPAAVKRLWVGVVKRVLLDQRCCHSQPATEHWVWLLFTVLAVKGQFREDFRGDCSYLSLRNDFVRMPFVGEDYFMVHLISFLLQVCFILHMYCYFLISEETVYSSLV